MNTYFCFFIKENGGCAIYPPTAKVENTNKGIMVKIPYTDFCTRFAEPAYDEDGDIIGYNSRPFEDIEEYTSYRKALENFKAPICNKTDFEAFLGLIGKS